MARTGTHHAHMMYVPLLCSYIVVNIPTALVFWWTVAMLLQAPTIPIVVLSQYSCFSPLVELQVWHRCLAT